MYNKILKLYKAYQTSQYHKIHKNVANNHLKNIELRKGKLSKELINRCDDYSQKVLGSKEYAPWLYVYTAMQNEFKEGWIPKNYYGEVVIPKLKGDYGKIANLKTLQSALFNSDLFPDLFYYVNGHWLAKNYDVLTQEYVKDYLRTHDEKHVFKIDNSQSGKGVFVIDKNSPKCLNLNDMMRKGNGIIQEYIYQHTFFDEIMPNSVATIRLTTANDDLGKVSLRGAYLRVGRIHDDKVTSASRIRIAINLDNGDLHELGYDNDLNELLVHPDTGSIFSGKRIPIFEKMVEQVIHLHQKVPFTRIIGWDLVVDKELNIKVMEWNGMECTTV